MSIAALCAVEHERFEGQPLEHRAGGERETRAEERAGAGRAVPFRRARRRYLRMGAGADHDVEREPVAADDSARRMHDDGLTDFAPLGIERLLHAQRTGMGAARQHRTLAVALEAEIEMRLPSRAFGRCGSGERGKAVHGPSVTERPAQKRARD